MTPSSITIAGGLPHASVQRTDRAELTTIGAGTGRYRARLARTGVQDYDTGPEHRDASEVFGAESVATLLNLRVQVGHVPNPGTAVGKVVMPFRRVDIDGNSYLEAELEIGDVPTRERIDRGEVHEISMGYECTVVDGHQRGIKYDHCALLERHQRARCGEHCRVHLDSNHDTPGSACAGGCSCSQKGPMQTDSFSDPRFPGKSRAYVESYLAACAERGLAVPALQTDAQQAREDAARAASSPASSAGGYSSMVTVRADGSIEVPDSFFEGTGMKADAVRSELSHMLRNNLRPNIDEIESALQSIRLAALARVDADADAGNPHRDGYHEDGLATYDSGDSASFSAHLARRARQMYRGDE